jgi:ABC-type antimicrobial peptide transport system permease subunit
VVAVFGIIAGGASGYALARVAGSWVQDVKMPGALPIIAAALVLMAAAVAASMLPAARAARVDVIEALRSE